MLEEDIVKILKKHDVVKAALFGSYARGEQTKKSDIDILIEFKGRKSLFDLVDLKFDLEENLEKKIDLVTYNGISPFLKDIILKEQKILYE
ncbi:hypothetical protein A2335_03460 [Candidatus Peregrinibacteria bacterium RIFOXYB2_FULL_32_7]|nr:MAG: hypothetical protein A2335_03460 [Candidatus Peregrinibacteria bacterium RIFOXYB2_FULL_32_7]